MNLRIVVAAALLATAGLAAEAMPSSQGATLKGEVLEVKNVETYTYVRLKTKEGETWAAVPTSPVKKGEQVTLVDVMEMKNFESRSLKRKFDRIVFARLSGPNAGTAAPQASTGPAPGHGATAPAKAPVGKVAKATGPNARTVAEVVAGKASLKGKPVTIRGQVVKVNSGILGKNWVHLQDGSGSAANFTHDIIVTTQDTAAVGDVVNVSGTVRTDVDVGSGYKYAVLVEDAKIRK